MNLKKRKIMTWIFASLLILIIQYLIFRPSFKLSLFGDDWLAFWRYSRILDIDPSYGFNQGFTHLTYFLTPYGPQDITMGLLQKVFEYNPQPYYIASFILRFLVSVALFYTVYRLTKSKTGALMSAAFFSITTVGLDTTNWVFNMTSYLGLIFALLFILYYFFSRSVGKKHLIFLAYFFLFLAIVIVPIRMHGALPLIVFIESYWYFKNKRKRNSFKTSAVRVILFLAIIWIIKSIGTSFADPNESISRIANGFNVIRERVRNEGSIEVFLYPLTIYGNMIFPGSLWERVSGAFQVPIFGRPRPFPFLSLLIMSVYLFTSWKTLLGEKKHRLKKFAYFTTFGFLFNFIVWIFYKISPTTFSSLPVFGSSLLGGYLLLFILSLVLFNVLDRKHHTFAIFVAVWPLVFIALPWLTSPYTIFPTEHRYLVAAGLGVALIWSVISLIPSRSKVFFVLFALVISSHAYATNNYLSDLAQKRSGEMTEKIWSYLIPRLPEYKGNDYYVVYFEGDTTNGQVIHNNAFFGFPPRMSMLDDIFDQDDIPVAITTYDELVAMVTYGGRLEAHAKVPQPLSLEQVYAFRIEGISISELKIIDIREEILEDLREEIVNYSNQNSSLNNF